MKVLLLGEYSGFHRALRDGLRAIGKDVTVAGTGDGSKAIPVDINIGSKGGKYLGKAERVSKAIQLANSASKYDLVQVINPWVFPRGFGLNTSLLRHIRRNVPKLFLSACGDDAIFVQIGSKLLSYSPIPDATRIDLHRDAHPLDNPADMAWNLELASLADGIIPVMHEYQVGYAEKKNCRTTIPLPINVDEIEFSRNSPGERLVVMHGAGRLGFKGSRFILEAFEKLSERYPADFEFKHLGNLPISQYLTEMRRVNIVVDQTSSYSCGMNALFAMAMGKVVLGGAELESFEMYGKEEPPVINIRPDVASIVSAIERLLDQRDEIPGLGEQSRRFVERHHNYKQIASRYFQEWVAG